MDLSDALSELLARRDDIPAQFALLMFFSLCFRGPHDTSALAYLLLRLLDLPYLLTLLWSSASLFLSHASKKNIPLSPAEARKGSRAQGRARGTRAGKERRRENLKWVMVAWHEGGVDWRWARSAWKGRWRGGGLMQGPMISGVTEWQVELWNGLIELELIN